MQLCTFETVIYGNFPILYTWGFSVETFHFNKILHEYPIYIANVFKVFSVNNYSTSRNLFSNFMLNCSMVRVFWCLHPFVCPQEGVSLYDVTSCLVAWSHVPSGGGCLCEGVSVKGVVFVKE